MALFRKTEATTSAPRPSETSDKPPTFLPRRDARFRIESLFMRVVATGGVIGIGTALAAILGSQEVDAWIIGLVISGLTVILAAILWSARTL